MKALEIEERKRIMALEQDYSKQILEQKKRMNKDGKRFYTCSIAGYQLIILQDSREQLVHTFIPTLEYINEVTKY